MVPERSDFMGDMLGFAGFARVFSQNGRKTPVGVWNCQIMVLHGAYAVVFLPILYVRTRVGHSRGAA